MGQIFEGKSPEEARELLKLLAAKWQAEDHDSPAEEAFRYYRGMRASLDEDAFRWGSLIGMSATVGGTVQTEPEPKPAEDPRSLRRERLVKYNRHRELFELEIKLARKVQRDAMALGEDWSQMESYLRDAALMTKASWMLWLAGILFKLKLPGAIDVCDAAAFELFRSVYLAA